MNATQLPGEVRVRTDPIAVAAAAAKDRRTMATPLRMTIGMMTSRVEIAVRVGSIS